MKKFFRPFNIFSALMIVAGFAFAFRLVNVFTPGGADSIALPATAQQAAPNEEPPPLTREELQKAVAETAKKADELEDPSAAPAPQKPVAQAVPPPPEDADDVYSFTASEVEILQSLSKRRDELDKREKKLAERQALLTAAEQEVDHKIAELNKLKGEIQTLLGNQQKMEEERILSLVKIYENMKPKEAATIFNTLDLDVLLSILGRRNVRKASPILENMDPEKARIVTIRLSEQRKLPEAPKPALPSPAP